MSHGEEFHLVELMVEWRRVEAVEWKQRMELDSGHPMNFGREDAEGESIVVAADAEPESKAEPILQVVKQVEVVEFPMDVAPN
mmetsp:Transcript_21971/g.37582  ORF Transcript_21971/g.37582 Transcript_21971/m.37582 type:complete len:83 (-) Transcript_21971:550-798(-)